MRSIVVAGVVRDCATYIRSDIFRLQSALGDFELIHWLIIESDSQDLTLKSLQELEDLIPHFRFLSQGALSEKYPDRTERIAACRNVYLKEIQTNNLYQDIDFVLIADLDGVNQLISQTAIASCFIREDWDVCTANQTGPYYDIWALRHPEWSPSDCWQEYQFLQKYGLRHRKAVFSAVYAKMISIPQDSDWIEVKSAFGGLAIYRKEVLQFCQYIGTTPNNLPICEHVTLHRQILSRGGHIFINPALINAGMTRETRIYFKPIQRLKLHAKDYIKEIFQFLMAR